MNEKSPADSENHGAEAGEIRVWQALPAITVVALLLRLVAIGFLYRTTWNDFENYLLFGFESGRIARSIAAGHGFGNPMFVETGPTAWMTPVYPCLLAGVFKLFGIYSRTSAFVILGFNSLFSALVCIPVFIIARRGFGRNVAVAACWTWALWPYSIYIASAFVWETCLSVLLLAILFLWTLKLKGQPGGWAWLGFGMLWGFSVLTNASLLSLFPFLAGWALYPLWRNRQRWRKAAALAALGLVIALLPWAVRNYRTFHRLIPLRDNFWLGFGLATTAAPKAGSMPQLILPQMRKNRRNSCGSEKFPTCRKSGARRSAFSPGIPDCFL